MELKFIDCNQENLEKEYSDYVQRVTDDKECRICTNVIVMTKYQKPKINCGKPNMFIKSDYKLMTMPLQIQYENGENLNNKRSFINFIFNNISIENIIKFAKVEDIDWNNV